MTGIQRECKIARRSREEAQCVVGIRRSVGGGCKLIIDGSVDVLVSVFVISQFYALHCIFVNLGALFALKPTYTCINNDRNRATLILTQTRFSNKDHNNNTNIESTETYALLIHAFVPWN